MHLMHRRLRVKYLKEVLLSALQAVLFAGGVVNKTLSLCLLLKPSYKQQGKVLQEP